MEVILEQIYFAVLVTMSMVGLLLGLQIGKMIRND